MRATALALLLWLPLAAQEPRLPDSRSPHSGRMNAHDKTWGDWQRRSGEQPPDFAALPSRPFLPDTLEGVRTRAEWPAKRARIRALAEKYLTGRIPPAPGNLRAVVVGERAEGGVRLRQVRLEFGPGHRGTLRLELLIPPGKGPFPVFLTNHDRNRHWVFTAVRRGYIACIYKAADPIYGDVDDSDAYLELYPEYDFTTLARWAWASSRAVDYLVTLPEAARGQIGVTGHSRGGKAALISAAFDDRIGAVIPSSGNTGECDPWRYTSDPFGNETLEQITGNFPHWFHPRLRYFAGREHKLPLDQNELMALVAPRGLMMYSSYTEAQGNSFGFEQGYRSVKRVYEFLGKAENVWLHLRAGEHATAAADVENFIDFFDTVFGRGARPKQETWVHGYTFEDWKRLSGESIDPARVARDPDIGKRILWALGEEPGGAPALPLTKLSQNSRSTDGPIAPVLRRPLTTAGMLSKALPFGDGLQADLYYPAKPAGKLPVVVWLHGLSYPTGYSRLGRPIVVSLVKRGFAVLAFDQIGFGTRVLDAGAFYRRYPRWSLMGKMTADTRAAIDAASAFEPLDASRIYLAGYDLGGKVALFTAALDRRVRGVAVASGVRPLRARDDGETEGIRHYSHLHGLLPRFGFFLSQPERLPLDDEDLLAAIAPRPTLVVAPTHDRYTRPAAVKAAVDAARRAWDAAGAAAKLKLETPTDFNRLSPAVQRLLEEWLAAEARP